MEHQAPPQSAVMHIIAGYWLSRAVYLGARLKLADAVGEKGATLEALASATGTRPDRLQRLLRALASHGFFRAAGWHFRTDAAVANLAVGRTGQHARPRRSRTRSRPLRIVA